MRDEEPVFTIELGKTLPIVRIIEHCGWGGQYIETGILGLNAVYTGLFCRPYLSWIAETRLSGMDSQPVLDLR